MHIIVEIIVLITNSRRTSLSTSDLNSRNLNQTNLEAPIRKHNSFWESLLPCSFVPYFRRYNDKELLI